MARISARPGLLTVHTLIDHHIFTFDVVQDGDRVTDDMGDTGKCPDLAQTQESCKRASRELQESFKKALRELQESFKRASREF